MNNIIFDRNINITNQVIDSVYKTLEVNPNFPYLVRVRFDRALNQFLTFLNGNIAPADSSPAWQIARRIVQLTTLHKKIERVRARILRVCPHPYFANKIKFMTMPAVAGKVKKLRVMIGAKGRLPFSEEGARRQFHEQCKKELQLQDREATLFAEKEFFHLLGNHLDRANISAVEIPYYAGNKAICSLESWMQVLNLWIKEGNPAEKKVGTSLLSIIQKSLPFNLKMSFAFEYTPENFQQDLTYFKDLARSQFTILPSGLASLSGPFAFLEKYKLERVLSPIPQSVLINETAWDRVASIHQMRAGERQLFTVGTNIHCIVVEVSCIRPAASSDKGNYQYRIFNTYVEGYHDLDDTKAYARPIIFKNLPQAAFSYSFFAKLIDVGLNMDDMKDFYQLHDQVLVEEFGGVKDMKSGALYPIQRYGTCTYAAVEVWMKSFLTEEQSWHVDRVKTQMAIKKQRKVVKIHRENLRGFIINGQLVDRQGGLLTDSICTTRVKAFKENRILLTQGEECMVNMRREQAIRDVRPVKARK